MFTGDLGRLLFANRLLEGGFNQRQDAFQRRLEACGTFAELREKLLRYYRELLPEIYQDTRSMGAEAYLTRMRMDRAMEPVIGSDLKTSVAPG